MKQEAKAMGLFGAWWVWVVILVIATSGAMLYFQRYGRNLETTAIRESNEFVQTKLATLQKLDGDCVRLQSEITALGQQPGNDELIAAKRAQIRAVADQYRSERSYLPADRQPISGRCAA